MHTNKFIENYPKNFVTELLPRLRREQSRASTRRVAGLGVSWDYGLAGGVGRGVVVGANLRVGVGVGVVIAVGVAVTLGVALALAVAEAVAVAVALAGSQYVRQH